MSPSRGNYALLRPDVGRSLKFGTRMLNSKLSRRLLLMLFRLVKKSITHQHILLGNAPPFQSRLERLSLSRASPRTCTLCNCKGLGATCPKGLPLKKSLCRLPVIRMKRSSRHKGLHPSLVLEVLEDLYPKCVSEFYTSVTWSCIGCSLETSSTHSTFTANVPDGSTDNVNLLSTWIAKIAPWKSTNNSPLAQSHDAARSRCHDANMPMWVESAPIG